ncbi:MAG: kynureninase, partial [Phycisphaerales bacterium]|nr:kynureninase [Phycisphaerales bacterium]
PTRDRFKVLIESPAFPSDEYAVQSQARVHGLGPKTAIVRVSARPGESAIREEDVEAALRREGGSIALMMIGGVNYATGQLFDMERLTRAGHAAGAVVGWDLAHAAGNVPLRLHDWGADFAAWCSYKYLNAGPGALGGCFVHEKHWGTDRPRFEGWWGNESSSRFRMAPEFVPGLGAEAWALSNPPILSAAPLRASLEIFDEVGMEALRSKSQRLTGYLRSLVERISGVRVLTPAEPSRHGAQLSLVVEGDARGAQRALLERGVVTDFREPNVIRAAPAPLYCTHADCLAFARALADALGGRLG